MAYQPNNHFIKGSPLLAFSESVKLDSNIALHCPERGDPFILRWNGAYWAAEDPRSIERMGNEWLKSAYPEKWSPEMVKRCYDSALVAGQLPVLPPSKKSGFLIPCKNLWLKIDAATGQISKIKPDKNMSVRYVIDVEIPEYGGSIYEPKSLEQWAAMGKSKFKDFIEWAQPNQETRALVQEYCGYTLIPSYISNRQVAQVWIGQGGNGKSQLLELVKKFHERKASLSLSQRFSDNGAADPDLLSASLAFVDDAPDTWEDEAGIKSLVAGGEMTIKLLYKNAVKFYFEGRLIVAANSPPKFRDRSDAMKRRFQLIPWDQQITEERKEDALAEKIAANEMRVVFDWMLLGALRFMANGQRFGKSDDAESYKRQQFSLIDPLQLWLDDAGLELCETGRVYKEALFKEYKAWCKPKDYDGHVEGAFEKALMAKIPGLRSMQGRNDKGRFWKVRLGAQDKPQNLNPIITEIQSKDAEIERLRSRLAELESGNGKIEASMVAQPAKENSQPAAGIIEILKLYERLGVAVDEGAIEIVPEKESPFDDSWKTHMPGAAQVSAEMISDEAWADWDKVWGGIELV